MGKRFSLYFLPFLPLTAIRTGMWLIMKLHEGEIILVHSMKAMEMQLHTFLILALDVGKWPGSRPAQRARDTH
jgi:hypothetical protein